jgi:hypothetical protein
MLFTRRLRWLKVSALSIIEKLVLCILYTDIVTSNNFKVILKPTCIKLLFRNVLKIQLKNLCSAVTQNMCEIYPLFLTFYCEHAWCLTFEQSSIVQTKESNISCANYDSYRSLIQRKLQQTSHSF